MSEVSSDRFVISEGALNNIVHWPSIPADGQSMLESQEKHRLGLAPRRKMSVIGLGYVGMVSMACLSSLGHRLIGVDTDSSKVEMLNQGEVPMVEEGLMELVECGRLEERLSATTDCRSAILDSEFTLVSVGTPSNADGSCNLEYLFQVTREIGLALKEKNDFHLVIYRSTVPPTTTREKLIPILEQVSGKVCGETFGVVFNPEFLRESTAVEDFRHPPKTVIGASDDYSAALAMSLYEEMDGPKISTSIESAEFVKYIDNTWHALKVSFGNEVGRICKAAGVDSHDVMNIFVQDTKLNISSHYLKPGFAFGGSCLPKDVRGMRHLADELNVDVPIIGSINESNDSHITHTECLLSSFDSDGLGIVGLTFKPGTDDLRESPSLALLKKLKLSGRSVFFYDPCVHEHTRLDADPEVNAVLQSCRCANPTSLSLRADCLLITHDADYAVEAATWAGAKKGVLDVVRSRQVMLVAHRYQGICW
jgi:GDP-mannose 6-dehydrogenase